MESSDTNSGAAQFPPKRRQKSTVSKQTFLVSLAIIAVVGFVAGTRSDALYATAAPLFGIKASSDRLDTAVLQKTYQELKANFDGQLDANSLVDGASKGMVAAAGDQYTVFMNQKEAEEFAKEMSGEVTGIGCEIGVRGGVPTVIRVLSDSPAAKAGMLAGDIFTSVNDQSVDGLDSSAVASKIRGEAGTSVKIAIQRGEQTNEFTIVRSKISDPSVRQRVENGVGTITITRFDTDTAQLVRQAAEQFKTEQVRAVVLDLRNNGGGYLDSAKGVASVWLNNKVVVSEQTNGKVTDTIKSDNNALLDGVKTVVLVNGGSASASEIVAGALQDHKAATLLGEKTFGKGTVQRLIDLPGGRQLKVTIARWFTPNGKNITKNGIVPNDTVTMSSDDVNSGRDPQLSAALAQFEK